MSTGYFSEDTIIAIATSMAGDGGVGIIRISGKNALKTAQKVTRGLEKPKPRFLHRVSVIQTETKEIIDDGLGVFFPEKKSFTGEEVVELHLHGGRILLQTVLKLFLSTNLCRMALPGEFSFRAVRNGKLSLSQAQSVKQLISAKSPFEITSARKTLSKNRIQEFDKISESLKNLLAQIELSIDFIDQDVEVISAKDFKEKINRNLEDLRSISNQMQLASRIAKGIQVSLIGSPNAGKSTLFNAILSEDRAIVSSEPGTTRDVITEEIVLGPYFVRLADTAGIRESANRIESEGILRAKDLASESDATVFLVDTALDLKLIQKEIDHSKKTLTVDLIVLNKSDTLEKSKQDEISRLLEQAWPGSKKISISALKHRNIDTFLNSLKEVLDSKFSLGLNLFLPTEFQVQMASQCEATLNQTLQLIEKSGLSSPEIISVQLHSALKALSDLVGETTPDTVLSKIFSEFCIGK